MLVISLISSRDMSFAKFCAPNPLKVAEERFPFFRLEVESVYFDFITFSFFQKALKLGEVGNFISQLTLPNIVSPYETGEIYLQFCI